MSSHHNRNPTGKNQHGGIPAADDQALLAAFNTYHREKLTNNSTISERLLKEHGIRMSASTVKRRRRAMGFHGSSTTMKKIDPLDAEQLVVDQMNHDIAKRSGVRTVQAKIAFERGIHLPRQYVSTIMHVHDSAAFESREPASKRILRIAKYPLGIHQRWAGDGHDKLYKIGFPIYALIDDATGKWLGAWVVPSNRMGNIIAYLYLDLIEKYGGMPLTLTTDCGSETTRAYGLAYALREQYHPDIDPVSVAPHVYLRSVHNISVERSWLRLRLDFGDNAVLWFNKGIESGVYQSNDPDQYELCQWLWPKLLNEQLSTYMEFRNGVRMRKDAAKPGPSGMSRNEAFSLYEKWGGRDCLLPIPVEDVREMKEKLGGEELLAFSTSEFAARAEVAYSSMKVTKLTMANIWVVFTAMLPLLAASCTPA